MLTGGDQQKLQTGYLLHQRGATGEAAKLYRELIEKDARNYHALHFLGLIEAEAGHFDQAKPLMARSLAMRPPNVQFIENYAALLVQLGDHADALQACRDGLRLRRDSVSLLYISATSLLKLGKFQESLAQFDKVLEAQPNHVAALTERSVALVELKKDDLALASVRKALAIDPNYADARLNLGNLCALQKRYEEALVEYGKALAINPRLADAYFGRGNVFYELSRYADALANYDKALTLAPNHAEVLNRKALSLLELGRFEEAGAATEKAIDLQPKRAGFYQTLTSYRKVSPADPHLRAMEALAQEMSSLVEDDQISLNFALAKALQDVGDYERSFHHLALGNALKRKQLDYDEAAALGLLERVRATFTADLIRERRGGGNPSSVPVFILGMPRSGSTLVEQILASHPQVFGAGEIADLYHAMADLGGAVADVRHTPEALSLISDDDFARLGVRYVDRIRAAAPAASRITNKTLMNFQLAGLIALALPNARIIHTRRDPVDTCLSCFLRTFKEHLAFTYDLGELGRYYRAYEALMAHWRVALPEGVMLDAQYEEIVADLEVQARRIVAHCGLEWDPRCLDFHATERPIRTASLVQVRQPIFNDSVGRWRAYESFLEPLLVELRR